MLRTTLLHEGWQVSSRGWLAPPAKLGFSRLQWLPARVPGHVHLDLERNGVIADPLRGMHELGSQWIDEEDWIYRTELEFAPDGDLPRRVLRFEGLDTIAAVFLNGIEIAHHDDMFVPLEVEVTERLRAGANELEVQLGSAARTGRERRARTLAAEGLDPATVRFDERAFVRKAQYMFGWDWGPRLVSAGIWQPVALIEHAGRLTDVSCRQRHLPGGDVELTVTSTIEGAGQAVEAFHFLEGREAPFRDGEAIRLQRPERWFPAGIGPQRLHGLESFLVPAGVAERRDAIARRALDVRTTRIGLREVRLVREPDAHGESFELCVNGERIWCLGANWIPDHSFPSAVTPERVREQLRRARGMNMNMLRVWGGGLYESEAFYDACDELGLLVWQDFAYACSYVPDDAAAQEAARREAAAVIRRLRNHPSLALWCGNNENLLMFQDKWDDPAKHPPRCYGQAIFDRVLPEALAELDPDRPYLPSSPSGGAKVNAGGAGDQHCWEVWHGRGDWKHYGGSTARFCSEFGFASAPGHRTLRRMGCDGDGDPLRWPVDSPIARWHDKTGKALAAFREMVELHYPAARDMEEWAYLSQLNQRDALRHGIEHWRRSSFCRGALVWQLNDCWPAQSWSVLDAEGEPKAAAFELRRLFAPALASLERDGDVVRLWAILDDAREPVRGAALLEARSTLSGAVRKAWQAEVEIAPGERRPVITAEVGGLDADSTILSASFAGSRTFRLLSEPKDARVADAILVVRATADRLVIRASAPVVDLFLWDAGGGLSLEENYLTLAAPGEIEIPVSGKARGELCARSLRGRHTVRVG